MGQTLHEKRSCVSLSYIIKAPVAASASAERQGQLAPATQPSQPAQTQPVQLQQAPSVRQSGQASDTKRRAQQSRPALQCLKVVAVLAVA